MKKSKMKGYVNDIESFGLVDGPGIRTVVFLGGCYLRCKYCQNPEDWALKEGNMTPGELVQKILRNMPYFKRNNGGVTFSGGEPLVQDKFLLETCKLLKQENIHIALDTAGVGNGNYQEILNYIDLVLLDIKHVDDEEYQKLTGHNNNESKKFIEVLNKNNIPVWIRQVIVPGIMDNDEYITNLAKYLKTIKNIKRIDFLPYHKLGDEKYVKLNIFNPYKDKEEMNEEKCKDLYRRFLEIYNAEN